MVVFAGQRNREVAEWSKVPTLVSGSLPCLGLEVAAVAAAAAGAGFVADSAGETTTYSVMTLLHAAVEAVPDVAHTETDGSDSWEGTVDSHRCLAVDETAGPDHTSICHVGRDFEVRQLMLENWIAEYGRREERMVAACVQLPSDPVFLYRSSQLMLVPTTISWAEDTIHARKVDSHQKTNTGQMLGCCRGLGDWSSRQPLDGFGRSLLDLGADRVTDVEEASRGGSYGVNCKPQDAGIEVAGGERPDGVAGEQCWKVGDDGADEEVRYVEDGDEDVAAIEDGRVSDQGSCPSLMLMSRMRKVNERVEGIGVDASQDDHGQ